MRETSTFGKIQDGVLRISRRNDFGESIKSLGDCRVLVIVKKLYKQRSTKTENGRGQNGYYWYIVVNLFCKGFKEAYEEPISMEKAHEILKVECNFTERVNLNTGVVLKQPQSTADLTTVEFEEYMIRCRTFIKEWFNIDVPLPNEQGEMIFEPTNIQAE